MKPLLLLMLVFLAIAALAQCGREYPSGFHHNSQFVAATGDTLNKLDSTGLYEGRHVYADNPQMKFNDSTSYMMGSFHHGQPIGEWKDHCKDGSYSLGAFNSIGEVSSNGNGNWITKKQGIYCKIGEWRYFDNKGVLQKTMRYDRKKWHHGWRDQTYQQDITGHFVLTEYKSYQAPKLESKYTKRITKTYTPQRIPVKAEIRNFWRETTIEYYPSGTMKTKESNLKKMGKRSGKWINIDYNEKGQVKCITKTNWVHPDPRPVHYDVF